jgi:hypothetical protein
VPPRRPASRSVYGAEVGVLVLETRFPRIPGDAGNAVTWPFPVLFKVLPGATPGPVVHDLQQRDDLLEVFVDGAEELAAQGVRVITTTAGFFSVHQRRLQDRLTPLVITSGLVQVPWLASLVPKRGKVGILTMESRSLSEAHLRACGIESDTPIAIQGLEDVGGYSHSVFVGNAAELDATRVEAEHVEAARRLCREHDGVVAIVLQSNAMPPYARAISAATNRPVYDLVSAVEWAVSGWNRAPFG